MKYSKLAYDVKTPLEYNKYKELKDCALKPKIKREEILSKMPSSHQWEKLYQSRTDKLYWENEKYKLTKELRAIEFDHMISNDLTFNPNINDNQNMQKKRQKVK